jgi:hypothetical protein
MLLALASHGFPNWGIAAIAVGALLVIYFAANLVGSALGFLLKNVIVIGALAVGFFFAAPYVIGHARGTHLQDRVRSTLHLQSLTDCSKAFNSIGTKKSATRLTKCGQAAKQDAKTQGHKLKATVHKKTK